MARDIQMYQRQVGIPNLQPVKFSTAGADLLAEQSKALGQFTRKMEDRAAENSYLRAQATVTEELSRIESQHQNSPDTLKEALDNFGTKFLDEIYDSEVRGKLELQFREKGVAAIARATAGRDRIITEEQQFESLKALDQVQKEALTISKGLFSTDPIVAGAAASELQELVVRTQGIADQRGPDGSPLLPPQARLSALNNVIDGAIETAVFSWFDSQTDKVGALKRFNEKGLFIDLPNDKGGVDKIDVRQSLSPQATRLFKAEAKRQISEQKAIATAARAEAQANLDIMIDTTDDPKQLIELQRSVDTMGLSPSARAARTIKIHKRIEELQGAYDTQEMVDNALTAGGAVDLSDKGVKKAVDNRYLSMQIPQGQELQIKSEFAAKLGGVPEAMKKEVSLGLRSGDSEQIVAASFLVDAVRQKNPMAVSDFRDEDLRLANAIRTNISLGYSNAEAVVRANEAMKADPVLKDARKFDYQEHIKANPSKDYLTDELDEWGFDPDVDSLMVAEFSQIAEQEFQAVGDIEAARKTALDKINKTWGKTEIGGERWMKYAPEKFYGVQNLSPEENSKWIRNQFKDDLEKLNIDPDNAALGVDPVKTKGNMPAYIVRVKDENGVLNTVMDNGKLVYWRPDRKFIVEEARKKRGE